MKKIFKALSILVASTALCAGIATTTACSGGYNGEYIGGYSYTNAYGATYGMMVKVTVENNIITNVTDITNTEDSLKKQGGYEKSWDGSKNVYEYKTEGVEWHDVSDGWTKYFNSSSWLLFSGENLTGANVVDAKGQSAGSVDASKKYYKYKDAKGKIVEDTYVEWKEGVVPDADQTSGSYGWSDSNEATWTNHLSWLLQQYVGKSASEILETPVYTDYGYSLAEGSNTKFVSDNSISGEPYEKGYNDALASSGLLITGSTQGSGRLLIAVQNALLSK